MGNGVKGFAKTYVDNVHSIPLIQQIGYLVIKGHMGQSGHAPPKSTMARSDPLVILYTTRDHTKDDLFHLARHPDATRSPYTPTTS